MKAHINGITIEGTPEEIAAYQRIKAQEAQQKPFKELPSLPLDTIMPRIWAQVGGYKLPYVDCTPIPMNAIDQNLADWYHSEPGYRIQR